MTETSGKTNYSSDEDTFVGNPQLYHQLNLIWKTEHALKQNSPSEEKLFQEREALIIKYMESFMGQEEDPYKTDKIPTTHYIKLQNGQMFQITVEYNELTRLPSKEEESEERGVNFEGKMTVPNIEDLIETTTEMKIEMDRYNREVDLHEMRVLDYLLSKPENLNKLKEAKEREKREKKDSVVESDDEHESIFSTPEARELYNKRNLENAELKVKIDSMTEQEKKENDRICQEVLGEPEEDF